MDGMNQILDNMETKIVPTGTPVVSALNLGDILKIPLIILLVVNIFFSIIFFLRARILADTVSTTESRTIKGLILIYLTATIIGSLLAILFLILG